MKKNTKLWLIGVIFLIFTSVNGEPLINGGPVMLGDLQEVADEFGILMLGPNPFEHALTARERFIWGVTFLLGGSDWLTGDDDRAENATIARDLISGAFRLKSYSAKVTAPVLAIFDKEAHTATGLECNVDEVVKRACRFAVWQSFAVNGKGPEAKLLKLQIRRKRKLKDMFLTYMQQKNANFDELVKLFEEDYHTVPTVKFLRQWKREYSL